MKNTVLSLCAFLVLCWVAPDAQAQGGKGAGRRVEQEAKAASNKKRSQAGGGAKEPKSKQARVDKSAEKVAEARDQATQKRQPPKIRPPASSKGKGAEDSVVGKKETMEKAAKAKGRDHQQQLRAFEKQRQRDHAKHMERHARLTRIRELAVQKGDANVIARVDKLIAKEQQVHERKQTRMQQQRRVLMGSESGLAETMKGTPRGRDDAKKGAEKADRKTEGDQDKGQAVEKETDADDGSQG